MRVSNVWLQTQVSAALHLDWRSRACAWCIKINKKAFTCEAHILHWLVGSTWPNLLISVLFQFSCLVVEKLKIGEQVCVASLDLYKLQYKYIALCAPLRTSTLELCWGEQGHLHRDNLPPTVHWWLSQSHLLQSELLQVPGLRLAILRYQTSKRSWGYQTSNLWILQPRSWGYQTSKRYYKKILKDIKSRNKSFGMVPFEQFRGHEIYEIKYEMNLKPTEHCLKEQNMFIVRTSA